MISIDGLIESNFTIIKDILLNNQHKNIGVILSHIRNILGCTQKEFGEKLGCKNGFISRIENNHQGVSRNLAKSLQKLTGIDYRLFL